MADVRVWNWGRGITHFLDSYASIYPLFFPIAAEKDTPPLYISNREPARRWEGEVSTASEAFFHHIVNPVNPSWLPRARSLFPHTSQGKLYLNHAGTSPLSSAVVRAIHAYLEKRSVGQLDTYRDDIAMLARCREHAAQLVNAESGERIAFQPSTSDAINVAAAGFPWKEGDHALVSSIEFPSNVYPYINLRQSGVVVDLMQAPDGRVTPEMIAAHVTPRTRLVALSAVQFLSGYRADLKAVGMFCRERNIVFAVDAIQALGAVRLDVQAMQIDFLAAGSQKWLMGPHGTGIIYVSEALQSVLRQKSMGWLSVEDPWDFYNYDQPLDPTARRYEGGSPNSPGLWGLDASLATILEFGPEEIERHILAITGKLMRGLAALPGVRVFTPETDAERAGIVTIDLDGGVSPRDVFKSLLTSGMTIALREGKLRYSPHFYNSEEEMEEAVERTRQALKTSPRPLP